MRSAADAVEAVTTFESLGVDKAVASALATIDVVTPSAFQRTVLRHTVHDFADILAETQPHCGKFTTLAVFAAHSVRSTGQCAIVVTQSATTGARVLTMLKKLAIDGIRSVSCFDDASVAKVGEANQVAVCTLNALAKANAEQMSNVSSLLVEDVAAHQASHLREVMEVVTSSSPSACMFLLSSKEPSVIPLSIRYMLRRSKRRYFFNVEGTPNYTFLMCHDQRDRSDLNCRLAQLSGLRRVLILTHNKEVRDLKAYLHQQLGFRTYSLQRNTTAADRERILSDFLESQYAILVAMDAFIGIDMMDVDAVIQYYPPQKSMADDEWSEFISCLNRTGNPRHPTMVWTLVGPEDFSLAAYFMKRMAIEAPVLNVAPGHPRFADIVRHPDLVLEEKLKLESGELVPGASSSDLVDHKGIPLPRSKQEESAKAPAAATAAAAGGSFSKPAAFAADKKKKNRAY